MIWSQYQKAIFKQVEKGSGNAAVVAVAGSGKTTTLTEALRRTTGEAFATSFNKGITEELKQKLPWTVQVRTFHSYCYRQVRRRFPMIRMNERKLWDLIRQMNVPQDLRRDVVDLVGKAKNCAMGIAEGGDADQSASVANDSHGVDNTVAAPAKAGAAASKPSRETLAKNVTPSRETLAKNVTPSRETLAKNVTPSRETLAKNVTPSRETLADSPESWTDLADRYDLAPAKEYVGEFIKAAHQLFNASLETCNREVDFDDQLYMVASKRWNISAEAFDWVMLDEAQDFNPLQMAILPRLLNVDSRILMVGDPRQSIYLFRGSDEVAFERLKERFGCTEMPLSISYRCARRIVQMAKSLVDYIESAPNAPDGKVGRIDLKNLPDKLQPLQDVVLCRNNAPLIKLALNLLRVGRAARVEGRDVAAGLEKLIRRMNAGNDFNLLKKRLDDWYDRERRLAQQEERPDKMSSLEDRYQSIVALIMGTPEGSRSVSGVLQRLETIFQDRAGVLALSTVHRAKGREWDRVFLLRPDLIPSRYAKTPAALQQEDNLLYVAYTRAKTELYLVMDEEQQERDAQRWKDENFDWQ